MNYGTALTAGASAGLAVDLLFFPLDTLKTRLQAREGFIQAGGFRGIYKGIGSVAVGSAPGAAFFFTSYEFLKSTIPQIFPSLSTLSNAPLLHMLAASGGEATACLIRVPTEVVKQRQQTSAYGANATSLTAVRRVLAESGMQGLYRGYFTTLSREIPFCCIQFPLYERFKVILAQHRRVRKLQAWPDAALCGSVAGAIAAGLTTPFDVAKTRIMLTLKSSSTSHAYSGTFKTIWRVYSEEGFPALFKGLAPRVAFMALGGACFLGVYELSTQLLSFADASESDPVR